MNLLQLAFVDQYPHLTFRAVAILIVLKNGRLDFTQVAKRLDVPPPAISRAFDRLCHYGLAKRNLNENDGRKRWCSLTDKGYAFVKKLEQL